MTPGLAVVLVGDDPASRLYVSGKSRKAARNRFPFGATRSARHDHRGRASRVSSRRSTAIRRFTASWSSCRCRQQIDRTRVIEAIRPEKDVDGFHPDQCRAALERRRFRAGAVHAGRLPDPHPPCARARPGRTDRRRHRPLEPRRQADGATPRQCELHRDGRPFQDARSCRDGANGGDRGCRRRTARTWSAATGSVRGRRSSTSARTRSRRPKKGRGKTRLVGDVAFEEARRVAGAITPVPGGVGPMTIALLMANTLTAAFRAAGLELADVSGA